VVCRSRHLIVASWLTPPLSQPRPAPPTLNTRPALRGLATLTLHLVTSHVGRGPLTVVYLSMVGIDNLPALSFLLTSIRGSAFTPDFPSLLKIHSATTPSVIRVDMAPELHCMESTTSPSCDIDVFCEVLVVLVYV
jgi:hypothetical protein